MKRAWYNARMIISVFLSISVAIGFVNYYFDLGYFGNSAKGVLFGVGSIGLLYSLFLTPRKTEFKKHGWWWKKDI